MITYPSHAIPHWSNEAREDALFHYTSASGLAGIFESKALWSTAYFCANDEQELSAGRGVLTGMFRSEIYNLEKAEDKRIEKFFSCGVDPIEYADTFEELVTSWAFRALCAYTTSFCRPSTEEDFIHGLLSQWRGYGPDGGYAIQFSSRRLQEALQNSKRYELKDVSYQLDNDFKGVLLKHKPAFMTAFHQHLDDLAGPIDSTERAWRSPLPNLFGGPLESLLDYLVYTKNRHFLEERECRMSAMQLIAPEKGTVPARYFNRNGLLVPYIASPPEIDILGCIDWIVIGPGPRIEARFKSIDHLIQQSKRNIYVRVSHIPYTRL